VESASARDRRGSRRAATGRAPPARPAPPPVPCQKCTRTRVRMRVDNRPVEGHPHGRSAQATCRTPAAQLSDGCSPAHGGPAHGTASAARRRRVPSPEAIPLATSTWDTPMRSGARRGHVTHAYPPPPLSSVTSTRASPTLGVSSIRASQRRGCPAGLSHVALSVRDVAAARAIWSRTWASRGRRAAGVLLRAARARRLAVVLTQHDNTVAGASYEGTVRGLDQAALTTRCPTSILTAALGAGAHPPRRTARSNVETTRDSPTTRRAPDDVPDRAVRDEARLSPLRWWLADGVEPVAVTTMDHVAAGLTSVLRGRGEGPGRAPCGTEPALASPAPRVGGSTPVLGTGTGPLPQTPPCPSSPGHSARPRATSPATSGTGRSPRGTRHPLTVPASS
jgi:hypothetical protein